MMLPALEQLYKLRSGDPNFDLKAFTMESLNAFEERELRKQVKLSFPLQSGGELARRLQIKGSPTVVFLVPKTGRFLKEQGLRGFGYLDEIVTLITGRSGAPSVKAPS
jgi:hypothetical protein